VTASALLEDLRQRGVTVSADGSQLRARPRQTITDDDITAMREHKAEILTLLAVPPVLVVDPDVPAVTCCNWDGCYEPVRLVQLHDGTEEQRCGSSHPQGFEPVTALPEPSGPPPMAPADDTGERRVVDYLERAKPLLPCRVCQRDVWEERAPGVWQCRRCGEGKRERAEMRAELLMWGEAHNWPRLPLAEGTAVPGGEAHWRITVGQGSPRSLTVIAAAIESKGVEQ